MISHVQNELCLRHWKPWCQLGGSAGRKLSDFLSCHLLPKSNPPIHQLSTPQNPKLELLPNGKQWQCTFEVFCITVAIHICQGTDSHPHSNGYFAMKRSIYPHAATCNCVVLKRIYAKHNRCSAWLNQAYCSALTVIRSLSTVCIRRQLQSTFF